MNKSKSFKRTVLATSIASLALTGFTSVTFAQEDLAVEEIVVLGVKGAQESAVNSKRSAASVVDSIAAEDIGKLPDATISDSLQRIPGIQIRRSAGEGGSVNVRGLPQVNTLLNGESYLGANSIVSAQPNFGDIPSQLLKGADVIKAPTANILTAGLTGTIDLKTRRPFDFKDDGFTTALGAEVSTGTTTRETDPSVNGLINWKNDKVGILVGGVYSKSNLSNQYAGPAGGGYGWVQLVGLPSDPNKDHLYAGPEGFDAFNKVTERERTGLNISGQVDLGEGFQLITDFFYTKQDEYNRQVGLAAENKWASFNYFTVPAGAAVPQGGLGNFVATKAYDATVSRIQSYSENNEYFSRSQDFNIELKYDNGGPFTSNVRFIKGHASQSNINSYFQSDLFSGDASNTNVWTDDDKNAPGTGKGIRIPGSWVKPNPYGWTGKANILVDYRGADPVWSGWNNKVTGPKGPNATIADYISDIKSYNTAAISSENNYDRTGDLTVFRANGSYKFDEGFITSIDAGVRLSKRDVVDDEWHGTSTFYPGALRKDGTVNAAGCDARWKATDVRFDGDCQVGEMVDGKWVPFTAVGYVPMSDFKTIKVSEYGDVKGIPPVYAVDPNSMDDIPGFHKKFYGNFNHSVNPGDSFIVGLNEQSEFVQFNFKQDIFSGNLGVRVIETELNVKQNITGDGRSYGLASVDNGDRYTSRSYTDVLPAFNIAADVTDDIKLRAAWSKNATALDLDQYGKSLSVGYTIDQVDNNIHRVTGVDFKGNPALDPWRSTNMDFSAEWYTAPGSLLSIGLFKVDIDSFPVTVETQEEWPDLDGIVRRTTKVSRKSQGSGGTVKGLELGAKQAFDFLPGFWSHFGVDANYTYSPSENTYQKDINGKHPEFNDNSKNQYNLVAWYQNEGLQARIAYNYRSERFTGENKSGLLGYQEATTYVDASVSYDINDSMTVSLNGSNITGEKERYYLGTPDQFIYESVYEPRYTLGLRTKF
ncbi:TonB-dependent receptor [Cellvibrio sp.]|uniref:TonB-dependent receptor n=1 Tax=Cellvibrio sp. TaxID=1965322 RepID=UPI003964789B